ncbi:MFS transporter [Rhodococcus opacus]|uniref:Putative proline/betaine transporter n=1 Tax=Rhodococcus opacus TaxID=37919 RepID=A0A2S8IYZ8_RHOOP|nr:MFS transporter [Rhodococcus opacus]PQP20031.1 MFS transporter [Rhodococcus opacus]
MSKIDIPTIDTRRVNPFRPAVASLIGTAVEWYDYFIYGLAAATVLGPLFFPEISSTAGTMAAFATFSVGFIARPLGGIVMGHFGDRIGRKSMLVTSLMVMGVSTTGIGLLPTYDSIGVWAPILLVALRFLQGFGVGGEWSGAVLMAVEHAPASRKGLFGSFPQMGVPAGLILANLVYLAVSGAVDDDAFIGWAWRLPFLASALLVIVGLVMRFTIDESPAFARVINNQEQQRIPIASVLSNHWRTVALVAGGFIGINAVAYVFMVYLLNYSTTILEVDRNLMLAFSMIASILWLVVTPLSSVLSDRYGNRRVLAVGSVVLCVSAISLFPLVNSTKPALIVGATMFVALGMGAVYGPMAALFSSTFPAAIRYSGTSVGYQVGSVLGGGIAPTVAGGLYAGWNSSMPITVYLTIVTISSLVCLSILMRPSRPAWSI